ENDSRDFTGSSNDGLLQEVFAGRAVVRADPSIERSAAAARYGEGNLLITAIAQHRSRCQERGAIRGVELEVRIQRVVELAALVGRSAGREDDLLTAVGRERIPIRLISGRRREGRDERGPDIRPGVRRRVLVRGPERHTIRRIDYNVAVVAGPERKDH